MKEVSALKKTAAESDMCLDFYELIERDGSMPPQADFAIELRDEAMLPYIKPGERIYVQGRAELEEFEAGLFLYEGRVICRQWCEDYSGAVHLLCANPEMERENINISREKRGELRLLGRVLLGRKLPAPVYS